MRRLIAALALAAGSIGVTAPVSPVEAAPAGCSAWVSSNMGMGYCAASTRLSARLATACRKGSTITYRYYPRWVSSGGVQSVSCPYGYRASSAFMQVR